MENVLLAAAVLACPVGMGLMMWFMARGMKKSGVDDNRSIADLRAEQQRLDAAIADAETRSEHAADQRVS